ncbi:FkbM family methyltransferase [Algoriphagus yeomjeoni]|uniref:FkbM family methyltransferase n=1 Tax=Algoriphagus yeomjeoni TaxID=291403 RepID=A0A327NZU3_9BACT|nr:FkbM family methyltransferase [Algoriphagus yeomjeoni]RAI85589.1 FkbM family methyltransferase [Algoriphagus yeomjeoni]
MKKINQVIRAFGVIGAFWLILYKFLYPKLQAFKSSLELLEWGVKHEAILKRKNNLIHLQGLPNFPKSSMWFRPFTSDSLVVRQHYFSYELQPVVEYFKQIKKEPQLMIDAGGNIGVATRYMQEYFPALKALVLEAAGSNCNVAKINLDPLRSILWEKALWWRSEELNFNNNDSAWAIRVSDKPGNGNGKVSGISLSQILAMEEYAEADFIKIDIEGAEEQVFELDKKLPEFLEKVACITVEPHSEYGRELLERKLKDWGYQIEYHGELIFGFR